MFWSSFASGRRSDERRGPRAWRRSLRPTLDFLEGRQLLATGLHLVPSPTVSRSILTATAAIAANDIWAVGFANLAPNPQQLLAEHWNGSSWSVVNTPNPGGAAGGSQFHGVAAAASNDVWAVGQTLTFDNTTGYTWHPLVEHWNGSAWSIVATPPLSPSGTTLTTSGELNAVTVISPTNVWAVGGL